MKPSAGQSEQQESSGKRLAVQGAADARDLLRRLDRERFIVAQGLYIHIPFCFHKCHYCDFYSIVDDRDRQATFTERLIDEAMAVGEILRVAGAEGGPSPGSRLNEPGASRTQPQPRRLRTIFIGGGTPTLLRPELWRLLLAGLHEAFDLSGIEEFTVEANPETVTAELLEVLAGGAVNRMSIGAQSFNPLHLKTLERWHDPANVEKAVRLIRGAGIENINLDLIFAIPGQTLAQWRADLDRALELRPEHLSCYSLMYEPNTPLSKKLELGRIVEADEELEADMFACTIDTLAAAGFEHYEVSNFARPGRRCEHNLVYWRNEDWLALGPSASGHLGGVRWKNIPHLGRYLASSGPVPIQDVEQLGADASIGEQLMLRLRLIEGVDNEWIDSTLTGGRRQTFEGFVDRQLIERDAMRSRLTRRGLMLADSVLSELL